MPDYLEGGDVRLGTIAEQRTREGGDVRLDQAADIRRLEPWQLRDDPSGRPTANDAFSTGRVEGTSGTRALTANNNLVTTDPSDPSTTFWGEDVTRVGDIEGGVEPGTPVIQRNWPDIENAVNGLPGPGDVAGALGGLILLVLGVVFFGLIARSFAEGVGQGVAS